MKETYKSRVYTDRPAYADFDVMEKYERAEKREALEQWVFGSGPEPCHKLIDEVWSRNDG